MNSVTELKSVIDNLTQNKQHVISEDAVYAKNVMDSNQRVNQEEWQEALSKQEKLMKEFDHSIRLLGTLFKESKFDEMMGMVAYPLRLMTLNFIVGLIRGIGFFCGMALVGGLLLNVFRGSLLQLLNL